MPPVTSTPQTPKSSQRQDQPLSPIFGHSPSVKSHLEGNVCVGDIVLKLVSMFKTAMTKRMQLQLITYLLKVFIETTYGLNFLHFIHGDIIETVISGVYTLYCNGKKNLLYIFSKFLSEDKLKLDEMQFGLIDYNLRFFHAVSCETGNGTPLCRLPRNYASTFWPQVDCFESRPYVAVRWG